MWRYGRSYRPYLHHFGPLGHLAQTVVSQSGGWTSVLIAVGTGILAFVALVGLVVANSRFRRGTPSVKARAFLRPGGTGIHVSATVQSTGLGRLKMVDEGDNRPTIQVTQ